MCYIEYVAIFSIGPTKRYFTLVQTRRVSRLIEQYGLARGTRLGRAIRV